MKNPTGTLAPLRAQNRRRREREFKVVAASLILIGLIAAVFHFSGDSLLNRFLKPKLEQAFSAHLPGSSLHLGALHYDVWTDQLECDSVSIIRGDGAPAASASSISARRLHWGRLLVDKPTPAQIFSSAQIEVTDLTVVLPKGEYRFQSGHLHISVPDSALTAQTLTLRSVMSDEAFFASSPFRRVRYRVAIASCSLRGVDFAGLINGRGYRARSLELTGAGIETLVDREKPRRPLTNVPLPHEVLAAITKPFRLDRLTLTNGLIKTLARRFEGAEPGMLIFTAVQINAKEIANAAAGGRDIDLTAEGRLMDAGVMTVRIRLPAASSTLAFHYSGELNAMDLTRLDEYMEGSGRIQIKSGSVSEAWFDIDVVDGHAHGTVRGEYRDLQVKVVNRDTGSAKGIVNRAATVLANTLKVRNENIPDKTGALKAGKVDYVRQPEDSFLPFAWLALRTGLLDLVSFRASTSP